MENLSKENPEPKETEEVQTLPAVITDTVTEETEEDNKLITFVETASVSNVARVSGSYPVIRNNDVAVNIDNYHFLEIDKQRELASVIAKSGVNGYNERSTDLVMTLIEFGRTIGIAPLTAIQGINLVSGKFIMSYHLMNTICIASRLVSTTIIDDYKPIPSQKDPKTVGNYVTKIQFVRKMPNGLPDLVYTSVYYYSDAQKAGLLTKDVWIKFPKQMMRARCFAEGARFVAPDLIGGGVYVEGEI
jgi:hypothetical protein